MAADFDLTSSMCVIAGADSCSASVFLAFLTLVNSFINSNANISEACDRIKSDELKNGAEYDFIVVGSGVGGSIIASRLSEIDNWDVLLLDSDQDDSPVIDVPSIGGLFEICDIKWDNETMEKNAWSLMRNTARWLCAEPTGDSGIYDSIVYTRGHPFDYANWANDGGESWIWNDVTPYFESVDSSSKIDQRVNTQNSERLANLQKLILSAGKELGFETSPDLNMDPWSGFHSVTSVANNRIRRQVARYILQSINSLRNLRVAKKSVAIRILFHNQKAIGIEYRKDGKIMYAKASKEVILADGVMNTPKLLLHSGIGPNYELKLHGIKLVKDLPGVGRNLRNQLSHTLRFTTNYTDPQTISKDTSEINLPANGKLQLVAIIASEKSKADHPDIELDITESAAGSALGSIDTLNFGGRRAIDITVTNMRTNSLGTVRLSSSQTSNDLEISPNYFDEPCDIDNLVKGLKIAVALMKTSVLRSLDLKLSDTTVQACSKFDFTSDEYWHCVVRRSTPVTRHAVGTCQMGPSTDTLAVVDSKLRVHGVSGLRVADLSVLPNWHLSQSDSTYYAFSLKVDARFEFRRRHENGVSSLPVIPATSDSDLDRLLIVELLYKNPSHWRGLAPARELVPEYLLSHKTHGSISDIDFHVCSAKSIPCPVPFENWLSIQTTLDSRYNEIRYNERMLTRYNEQCVFPFAPTICLEEYAKI